MSEIFITSDLHLSHDRPFIYNARGFESAHAMNESIVRRWNSIVKNDDTVYMLGDFALNNIEEAIESIRLLKGNIIWLLGNHDGENKVSTILEACPQVRLLGALNNSYATVIKSGKWSFYLSHYPTYTMNHEPWRKVVNLCGHSHVTDRWADWNKMCYHIEMDAHNCFPVNIEKIKEDIYQMQKSSSLVLDQDEKEI